MFLGIDTSAYTTSIALVKDEKVVLDKRILLNVDHGSRGLRQSEAVFQHLNNLKLISDDLNGYEVKAVGVSTKPTQELDSYMPVFKVGESFAKLYTKLNNITNFKVSHQDGHVAAGVWSSKIEQEKILVVHVSGGTTDFLQVINDDYNFDISLLGNSTDLHAGQFIDRVGVRLGSKFPAGDVMDQWAQEAVESDMRIPSSVKGNYISFSGPETAAQRLIKKGYSKESIAYATFICISRSIEKVIRNIYEKTKYDIILLVGGVARNSIIKKELIKRLPLKVVFCEKKYSSDNAVGVAVLAEKYFNEI